jgi:hypothetical protein
MRYGLIDLLMAIAIIGVGAGVGVILVPGSPGFVAGAFIGVCAYLAALCPIYRKFRLLPMILPRCPCCGKFQNGYHFTPDWPRVTYRCPSCNGAFVIWHNGEPGAEEPWDKPVLALKWPYAFGRFKRMERPEQPPPAYPEGRTDAPSGSA